MPRKVNDEAIVVGAGPAGLAAAAVLQRAGVPTTVLERTERVGSSWRQHYDRLHLHTARWWSGLPGYPIPRRLGRWVSRDGVVRYLEEYARQNRLDIRFGVEVERVERSNGGWRLPTSQGEMEAEVVVMATGYNRRPFLPEWPGRDGFSGTLLHASEYRNPSPFRGRDVLVVGAGNSGAEIAVDLVEGGAGRVRISIRTPPTVFPRDVLGMPSQAIGIALRHAPPRVFDTVVRPAIRLILGDLSRYGMPRPPRDPYTHFLRTDVVPILDVGLVRALKKRRVEVVPAVAGFDDGHVVLADERRVAADAVIAATGYRRALTPLVGHLGVLDERERPRFHGPHTHPDAPGLYFIGFTNPISGNLRELAIDAKRIARAVAARRHAAAS